MSIGQSALLNRLRPVVGGVCAYWVVAFFLFARFGGGAGSVGRCLPPACACLSLPCSSSPSLTVSASPRRRRRGGWPWRVRDTAPTGRSSRGALVQGHCPATCRGRTGSPAQHCANGCRNSSAGGSSQGITASASRPCVDFGSPLKKGEARKQPCPNDVGLLRYNCRCNRNVPGYCNAAAEPGH